MAPLARSTCLLSVAALVAVVALPTPLFAQFPDIRALFNAPAAATVPAGDATAPDWSGESGGSNHPLMTAQAIRAAAADFRGCLAALWPLAERRGVSRSVFDANLAGLTPELRIMDLLDCQTQVTTSFWGYLYIL